jgi:hypothetical protein
VELQSRYVDITKQGLGRVPAELQAVISAQYSRQTARGRERIEDTRDWQAADGPRGHDGDGFGRGVVDDRQTFQDASLGRPFEDEVC